MLDQLPDDVLAMVMSLLSVKGVLACRPVCKRLAALAQHPDVWRHRRLVVDKYSGREFCPSLRLAPCVRKITASDRTFARSCRHCDLRTTSCAARELSIAVTLETEKVAEAVQIVKQQEALGRLQAVSFTSDLMPGLKEVAACESLRSLKLTVGGELEDIMDVDAPGARELLRSAHQLRSLHLRFLHDDEENDHYVELFAASLISALASSGRSQVEVLVIKVEGAGHDLILDHLRSALPSLPALRRLKLNIDPYELMPDITHLTVPSLRSLRIGGYETTRDVIVCSHAFLHSEELESLMSRNPLLHVELRHVSCRHFKDKCDECKLSCHKDVEDFVLLGIFAHPKDECPSPEAHVTNNRYYWVHINDVLH